jgi:hypothetical protein
VPYGALRGGVPSEQGSTALVMAPQCVGWLHRAWDGRTESEVTGGTCSTHPASRHRPRRVSGWWAYAPRGRRRPFSMGAAWRKDGSGWHSVE